MHGAALGRVPVGLLARRAPTSPRRPADRLAAAGALEVRVPRVHALEARSEYLDGQFVDGHSLRMTNSMHASAAPLPQHV